MKKRQRHTYRFNPHTLKYEKVFVSLRDKVKRISFNVLFGVVLGVLIVVVGMQIMESPSERAMKRELAQFRRQSKLLNDRVDRAEKVLENLEDRDDNLYRTIFSSEPVSAAERHSGIGGVERYAEFDNLENGALLKSTTQRVDELTKRLYVESKSMDEIYEMARTKNAWPPCRPSCRWPRRNARWSAASACVSIPSSRTTVSIPASTWPPVPEPPSMPPATAR